MLKGKAGEPKMKVGMFVHTLDDRAVAKVTTAVSHELSKMQIETFLMFATKAGKPIIPDGVEVVDLGIGDRSTHWGIFRVIRALRRLDLDAIFAHSNGTARVILLARMFVRRKPRVIVVSHRNYAEVGFSHRWIRDPLTSFLYKRAEVVAGVSPGVVAGLEDVFPHLKGKTVVLPNPGPDPAQIETIPVASHRWIDSSEVRVVVSVGNIIRRKGHDITLRAFRVVLDKHDDARLIIIGRFDEPEYLAELKDFLSIHEMNDAVDIVGYDPDPIRYVRGADVFVLASRNEGAPLVIVESMTLGVPVVATDCPSGPRWLLENGDSGILVPMDDPDALARGILEVLDSSTLGEHLSEAGMKRSEYFQGAASAARYLAAARSGGFDITQEEPENHSQ